MSKENTVLISVLAVVALIAIPASFVAGELSGIICTLALTAVFVAFFVYTRWRYRRIAQYSDYLLRLSRGELDFDIQDNGEGELSILKNNIYKLSTSLGANVESLSKDKEELKNSMANISHQLKTPLTSFKIMATLLDDPCLPPEKRKEFSRNLHQQIQRMEWLVTTQLKLARLDSNIVEMASAPIEVSQLLSLAQKKVEVLLDLRGQQLVFDFAEGFSIECDKEWTAEALGNIMKNASEHSPDGAVIRLGYGKNPLCHWISIQDEGEGMPKEEIQHIFKRFYKTSSSKSDSFGIGMPLSLAIMRRQNGDIEVRQNEDKGLTMFLKFYANK